MTQVPHHEQQYEFTCGPASLMMIFKHFDKKFEFTNAMETDIWRESSLAPLPPTSRYGLAYSALKRGHAVEIHTNVKGIEYVNKTPPRLTGGRRLSGFFQQFLEMMQTQFEERKRRALELGLLEKKVNKITSNDVANVLSRKGLSIMLTSARFFDDQDWAHWVVVTGHDSKDNFYINDPASNSNKGRRLFSREKFEEINGYYGDQVLVSVFR
ncbi:MAG: peptidase C39 family protein [Nitrososphaerota archaeon]|nr:peptidase C39 family protein [Nitrososphaerota archaeon]MDG6923173.1 peptidase C39 family protein [Nitrososphaerota archaeon]